MDDLDGRVGEQVVERLRRREATPSALARAAPRSGGAAKDAADRDADAAQRLDVDGADEAGPDDRGSDVGRSSRHAQSTTSSGRNLSRHLTLWRAAARAARVRQARSSPWTTLNCQVQKSGSERTKGVVSCPRHGAPGAPAARRRGARCAGHGARRDPPRAVAIALRARRADRAGPGDRRAARRRARRPRPRHRGRPRAEHRRPTAAPARVPRGCRPRPRGRPRRHQHRRRGDQPGRTGSSGTTTSRPDIEAGPEVCLDRVDVLFESLLRTTQGIPGRLWGIGIGGARARWSSNRAGRSRRRSCRAGTAIRSASGSPRDTARPVWVDNDVNLLALGEWRAGVAAGHDNVVVVKVGTGIGAGHHLRRRISIGARRGAPATSATSRSSTTRTSCAGAGTSAASRPWRAARRWHGRARRRRSTAARRGCGSPTTSAGA